jgi:hypothetical protein
LNVSEHQGEPISGETGSLGTGPAASGLSETPSVPMMAQAAADAESPKIAPEQEETAPKGDSAKADSVKADSAKADAPKVEAARIEDTRPEAAPLPGKLMIMSPGNRAWDDDRADAKAEPAEKTGSSAKRRVAAMAAVVALAIVAGALGGALATAGYGRVVALDESPASAKNGALEASVARIDADLLALKAGVEHTAKMGMSQFNKTSERLDKVEKAQAEPTAKLAKLNEAVDKLRAAPPAAAPAPVAAVPAAGKDVTGTVTSPATTTAAAPTQAASAKPEVSRLPTVEGWVLRDVSNGSALIEGHRGMYEVYAGDPVPGLGRVDAIRRQDGRWVVVTSKGLIVAR